MILLGAALLSTACSRPAASVAPPAADLTGEDLFIACAEVFKPGETIDGKKAVVACHDVGGTVRTPQYIRCTDGRHLWRIDADLSENPGWGFTGNIFYAADDLENDPDLAEAMIRCRH